MLHFICFCILLSHSNLPFFKSIFIIFPDFLLIVLPSVARAVVFFGAGLSLRSFRVGDTLTVGEGVSLRISARVFLARGGPSSFKGGVCEKGGSGDGVVALPSFRTRKGLLGLGTARLGSVLLKSCPIKLFS